MRRFIIPIVMTLCLAASATGATMELDSDYTQMIEDVDIMARIIDKTLAAEFPDEYRGFRAGNIFGSDFDGCQGIYLRGFGAGFMTRIDFPVAERKVTQEEIAEDDLWQRTKYELKGGQKDRVYVDVFAKRGAGEGYDPKKVEQLKEELLKLIGTYAANMSKLGSEEHVAVVVFGARTSSKLLSWSTGQAIGESVERETRRLKKELDEMRLQQEKAKEELEKLLQQQGKSKDKLDKRLDETGSIESAPGPPSTAKAAAVATPVPAPPAKAAAVPAPVVVVAKRSPSSVTVSETNKVIVPGIGKIEPEIKEFDANVLKKEQFKAQADQAAMQKLTGFAYGGPSTRDSRGRTTLIIIASKEDIMAYKNGRIDLDQFTEQADIIQY